MATTVVLGSTLSCSQDEVVTNDGDQKDPISFNVNVGTLPAPDVTTRGYTTTSAETGYTFSGGEYMAVGLTHTSGSEVIKQYSVGLGSSGNNALTYQKESDGTTTGYTFDWLSTSETVTIRAWSDGKTTTASTPVADPDGQPFTVETTQTGDVKELLYSPATSYAYTTSAINIPLYHQLARIVVTIVRANTSTPISSVTIGHNSTGNRVPIIGTFAKPTGTGVNYGTWSVTSEATQSTHWGVITPKEETAGSVYSAVVIPGGATEYPANTRLFNITIGSEVFAYKIPTGGLTLEAGKQYNYTITVENMGITVTSNITDWYAAVPGTDFTHGDGLALSKSIKMNPLWYMAEYNMKGTNIMAPAVNDGYFYIWSDAMSYFAAQTTTYADYKVAGKVITGQEGTWHLPVRAEYWSIIPGNDRGNNLFAFDSETNGIYSLAGVIFGYNSETKAGITDNSYWRNISVSKCRAIRFLGENYCSAWEYEVNGSTITITASLIDNINCDISSARIAYNEIDWDNLGSGYFSVQRSLYCLGYKDYGTSTTPDKYQNQICIFWSATISPNTDYDAAWTLYGHSTSSYCSMDIDSYGRRSAGFSIRLFRDN